ncbi:MAG: FIST C-terminal domain-containing protein [Actinomycetota bacterium]|nr:FIST C-terminal domain-containing protein [Actinomycetota bacterium]
MAFAAALSEHPDTASAAGEVTGQVLEAVEGTVDLALLFVTSHHARALPEVAEVVQRTLAPSTLVGCAAVSVLANGQEVEEAPAISLWAGSVGAVQPVRVIPGQPIADPPFPPSALLLVADPFTFPAEAVFDDVAGRWPGLPVVGGMASAARQPGGTRLLLDDQVHNAGAVGAFLGPDVVVETVVSQGCKPIGRPYAVTRADVNIVQELAGRPPIERLVDIAQHELTESEVAVLNHGGLHVGRVIDEHKTDFERGDFLVRNLIGADQREGWIAIGESVKLGTTLQYHLRDADSADDDLRAMLTGRTADSALVFTCNGRGSHLFGQPHHDAKVLADYLGSPPVAGFFAAGEFGPVGGRNFVHGFTASVALLRTAK